MVLIRRIFGIRSGYLALGAVLVATATLSWDLFPEPHTVSPAPVAAQEAASPPWSQAEPEQSVFPKSRHVIVMVMDGARYDHTLGDPERRYLPTIKQELEPRAAVHSRFYNSGHTITTSGHATILTGKTQQVHGEFMGRFSSRTVLELAREQRTLPAEAVWLIFGKQKLGQVFARSMEKGPYRPSMWAEEVDDTGVAQQLWSVLETHRPIATVVNFPSVDRRAHAGDWDGYLNAIGRFDALAAETWRRIQADPVLKDRTTLFITNDHGRRKDDWREHGDVSDGSRRIMFMAMGPDIKPGMLDDRPRDLEDLAATVALLTGVEIAGCDGEPIQEIFHPR